MANTLRDLLEEDERSPIGDDDLDTAVWLCLVEVIHRPADLDRFEREVAHYFASRLMQWDVANGGFAQAALNIPQWFERAAAGYRAIGSPRMADLILEVARRLPENEKAVAGLRSGEIAWEDYFQGHAFHVHDEEACKNGEWEIDADRVAYVRAHRNAFKLSRDVV